MIRVQGPVVPLMWSTFVWDWEMETGDGCSTVCNMSRKPGHRPTYRAQLIPSGPFVGGDCIQQSLLLAIYQARHHLVLTTPISCRTIRWLRPLFGGGPRRAGAVSSACAQRLLMANHASNSFMEDLLAAGVEIYRYDAGLLHTKSVLVDDDFALVGTVSLDRRSLWLNFGITLLIDNPVFVAEMNQLVGLHAGGDPMSLTRWRARPGTKLL